MLALRRAKGTAETVHKLEFAGGKIEEGESSSEALVRECREELSAEIETGDLVRTVDYTYPEFSLTLSVYYARLLSDFTLNEHEEALWLDCASLKASDWAPADRDIVNILKRGEITFAAVGSEDGYAALSALAGRLLSEAKEDGISSDYDMYILEKLRLTASGEEINRHGTVFHIIKLNGEDVGFYCYCPASWLGAQYASGTFLCGVYILRFARGKRIFSRIFPTLRYPVYVSVSCSDSHAISLYKHGGFKIVGSHDVPADGGAVFENFILSLGQ